MNTTVTLTLAAAATTFALGTPAADGRLRIQVTPDGNFVAGDGRPTDVPAWRMNADNAQRVIAAHALRRTPTVIDYDHQTLYKEKNGQPALAAAWIQDFEYSPGQGLFAWVTLTARAAQLIAAEEMKFFSPVFAYDPSGNVTDVLMGAFTNTPAVDGMAALTAAASARFIPSPNTHEDAAMEELLKALRTLLGLADDASAEDVTNAITQLKAGKESADTKVAALTAQVGAAPDPARFVPIDTFNQLQTQVAALSRQQAEQAVAELVAQAEGDLKITAATKGWFTGFAQKDIEGAKAWLASAPALTALSRMQSGNQPRAPQSGADEITDPAAVAVLARKYQDEQRQVGIEITAAAAVAHVTRKKEA